MTIPTFVGIILWTCLLAWMQLHSMRADRKWRGIWRRLGIPVIEDQMEMALVDFVIAYEEQEPNQLLEAYYQAGEVIEIIRKA